MCENVNINVSETNETINIVSSEIQEVIDINVFETTEDVTLNITEQLIQVNINKVTGGGGEQTLAETLVFGNNTGGTDILLNNDDKIQLENNSSIRKGTYDFGQNGGVSRICGVDYEDMWQGGIRHVFDTNGLIRNSTNCFNVVPNNTFDVTLRFKVGSIWTLDDGTNYICTDATEGAAVWELYNVIPTSTSDLTNDGEDGVNPFITAADVTPQVNSNWDATSGLAEILNKPILAAVATSGNYEDLSNVPKNTSDFVNDGADGNNPFITAADVPASLLVALPFTTDHLTATNNAYVVGDVVWYLGNVYRCIANNDSILPTVTAYWTNLGAGNPLVEQPTDWNSTSGNNQILNKPTIPTGTVTSVGLTMPSAFSVANSPITSAGTLSVTGAGVVSQYVRGDGSLANFPTSTGGGASLSFYLNGSVSQGTIGGVAFREMDRTPILGAGTDFTINANGYIQSFITDANVPNLLEIPAGNWNFETYFSASSNGGSPSFYVELYKWNGTTLSLIASNSATPEGITNGTAIDLYVSALAVPQTTLLATDRLSVRIYVTNSGRTIKLHTENSHLCQVITTFSTGLTALNGLTTQVQSFATGTSGTDFGISSATSTHTFNLPTASATNRGALSSADWSTFNGKQAALVSGTNIKTINGSTLLGSGDLVISDSNIYNTNGTLTSARTLTSGGFPLTFTGSNTAASAIARGLHFTHTLVAAANSDVLVGLDIAPTFTNGAFTGVKNLRLRVGSSFAQYNSTLNHGVELNTNVGISGTLDIGGDSSILYLWRSSARGNGMYMGCTYLNPSFNHLYFANGIDNAKMMILSQATGNLMLNTTTDAGFRLDVNGTARVQATNAVTALSLTAATRSWYFTTNSGGGRFNSISAAANGLTGNPGSFGFVISNGWNFSIGTDDNSSNALFGTFITGNNTGQVRIGTQESNVSAILSTNSTTQGFLPPRMTTTQKNAIATPAAGLVVYDTTLNKLCVRTASTWETITST